MKYYDITMAIEPDMMVYKNKQEKKPIFTKIVSSTYETMLNFNLHTGTHIDFPSHIFVNGKTSTNFELTSLFLNVKVFDLTHLIEKIEEKDLVNLNIKENDFIMLKTKNSFDKKFSFEFVYLTESGAKFLALKKIKGVGIDSLGIERNQTGHLTHKVLFENNVIIMEGVNLQNVPQGKFEMIAMPMKILNTDALPVSAVLVEK